LRLIFEHSLQESADLFHLNFLQALKWG